MDRESIERRDFPTARRGYEQAAVDAHLRALAGEVEALARRAEGGAEPSLSTAAAGQVQGILEAAGATAAEIEREARGDAQRIREEAAHEAERARAHVEALARATAALRERVEVLDSEVGALARSLRAGEGEPPGAVPAAAIPAPPPEPPAAAQPAPVPAPPVAAPAQPAPAFPAPASAPSASASAQPAPISAPSAPVSPAPSASAGARGGNDLDGARLVALNMALGGEPREQADRCLAESFELADREKLLDEVYAAIDG